MLLPSQQQFERENYRVLMLQQHSAKYDYWVTRPDVTNSHREQQLHTSLPIA